MNVGKETKAFWGDKFIEILDPHKDGHIVRVYPDYWDEKAPEMAEYKEWVGLTNEEIEDCFDESCHLKVVDPKGGIKGSVNIFEVGRAIEAKFKEKNHVVSGQ